MIQSVSTRDARYPPSMKSFKTTRQQDHKLNDLVSNFIPRGTKKKNCPHNEEVRFSILFFSSSKLYFLTTHTRRNHKIKFATAFCEKPRTDELRELPCGK